MNILLQRGNFNGNRSVPSNFMLDIEDSVIKSDAIKSFDCTCLFQQTLLHNESCETEQGRLILWSLKRFKIIKLFAYKIGGKDVIVEIDILSLLALLILEHYAREC